MASKRRIRNKQCTGKIRHADPEAAKARAWFVYRQTAQRINAYKCKFCKGWHIGHTPGSVRRAMAAKV